MNRLECLRCGHPVEEHAELVQAKGDVPERRQCLHGVVFTKRTDARGGMFVSSDPRGCACEKFVSKSNGKVERR